MPSDPLSLACHFADLPDPRVDRTKRHALGDILVIALAAVVCGADSWEDMEEFGRAKERLFRRFLALPNGIPSHDTFYRVFAALDPRRFADCFGRWAAAVGEATGPVHIAIDGKAVRGTAGSTFSGCRHLVSAWAAENRLILGQQAVGECGHEITTIPELLKAPDPGGAVVTIDAAGCQTEIAERIRGEGGRYVPAVKGNRPKLDEAIRGRVTAAFEADFAGLAHDACESVDDGHGRHEGRYVTVIYDPPGLPAGWPDVAAVVAVSRERRAGDAYSTETGYYITSLAGSAAELGGLARGHWGIENGLHWALDVAFREDASRTRAGHAGENLGLLRRVPCPSSSGPRASGASRASG
jgi:predicted transposase YbfD/YdcC